MKIVVSAPGKLIISGEHSVLHGYSAIAIAIKQRLELEITELKDAKKKDIIIINSNKFGSIECNINEEVYQQPEWCGCILFLAQKLNISGISIDITSKIDDYGFGVSGALFASVGCGLIRYKVIEDQSKYNIALQLLSLYREYCKAKKMEKFSSGTDLITSIMGGVVYFEPKYNKIITLPTDFLKSFNGITAIYTGHKTPTKETFDIANAVENCKTIYEKIGFLTEKIYLSIVDMEKDAFAEYISRNQECLQQLNLCDTDINDIIEMCKKKHHIAKLSGSGLGDCVIVFDKVKTDKYKTADIKIDNKGVIVNVIK